MATSIALSAGRRLQRRALPRHLRRRFETLIPVSLRLLDESGRRRIAEPMLGIAVEVAGEALQVSVMGRSGRPLSYGLARKQKVVVSFLATDLHEKVESLVCELASVDPVPDHPDAWQVGLRLPSLMPELAEDIIGALARYGRTPKRQVGLWTAAGLMAIAALGAWAFTSWSAEKDLDRARWRESRLKGQIAFSNQTVDQLARALEEADREIEVQRQSLVAASGTEAALSELQEAHAALTERLAVVERAKKKPPKVHLRGVSLTDFRTVRSIRGAATAPRLVYRNGVLELTAPGPEQRRIATNAGRLLEAFAEARSLPLRRFGSWSLESTDGDIGVETELAFVLGDEDKKQPDFVLETRDPEAGDWLAAYTAVELEEVWSWHEGRMQILRLVDGDYAPVARSGLLPNLDPSLLARFIVHDDADDAVREFIQAVK